MNVGAVVAANHSAQSSAAGDYLLPIANLLGFTTAWLVLFSLLRSCSFSGIFIIAFFLDIKKITLCIAKHPLKGAAGS